MSDKLQDTLAALQRGEEPGCPRCGAPYSIEDSRKEQKPAWYCGSEFDDGVFVIGERGLCEPPSRDSELATLRAENAKLRNALKHCLEFTYCEPYGAAISAEIRAALGEDPHVDA